MKKIFYLLLIAMTMLVSNQSVVAKCDDDSEETIPIRCEESSETRNGARSIVISPVAVTLTPSLFKLNINFLDDIGMVSVKVTNHLTGAASSFDIDSKVERTSFIVPDGEGFYTISFQTEDGAYYSGHFFL